MSVSSVSSISSSLTEGLANWASSMKKVQSEFKQLGQDLQSGNVTQAESDYTTLTQDLSSFSSTSTSAASSSATTTSTDSSTSSLADALNTLGQDLQSGNLTAAQSDFKTVQNDLQQTSNQAPPPPPPSSDASTSTSASAILKELSALGDDLSSSDLTSAQTAYTTLQQDLSQLGVSTLTSQLGTGQVSLSG